MQACGACVFEQLPYLSCLQLQLSFQLGSTMLLVPSKTQVQSVQGAPAQHRHLACRPNTHLPLQSLNQPGTTHIGLYKALPAAWAHPCNPWTCGRLIQGGHSPWVARAVASGPGASGEDSESRANVTRLKADLLQTVSRLNSTLVPSTSDSAALLQLVAALAALNPTPVPETSPLMNGRWVLLYTSNAPGAAAAGGTTAAPNQGLSFLQAMSDSLYKWFYNYVPILAGSATGKRGSVATPMLPLGRAAAAAGAGGVGPGDGQQQQQGGGTALRSRGNFQTFDLTAGTVSNEARFEVLGAPASITVLGTAEVVQGGGSRGSKRLRAMFTSFSLTVDGQQRVSLPLGVPNLLKGSALQGPVGYVDTCFLDQQLRISSGDKGSLFITIRDEEGEGGSSGASRAWEETSTRTKMTAKA